MNNSINEHEQIVQNVKRRAKKQSTNTSTFSNSNVDNVVSFVEFDISFTFHVRQSILQYFKFTFQFQIEVDDCFVMKLYFTKNRLNLLQNRHFVRKIQLFNFVYQMLDRNVFDEFLLNKIYETMSNEMLNIFRKNNRINFVTDDSNNINQNRIINLFCNLNDIFYYFCNENISDVKHETDVLIK